MSIDTRDKAAPAAAGEGGPSPAARPPIQERHPFTALPSGWAVIGRCRFGTGLPGPHATGCYALAHPAVGVALLDIAPNATPNAEARLRRALTAAEFWPDFPGTLPVMHDRVDGAALRSLPWVLERGFAALPPLTVPGGGAWIDGVRGAMASDPAWELPGQPKAPPSAPPAPPADDDAVPLPPAARSRPRWKRLAVLPVAFVATFAVGIVCGLLLLDAPSPGTPQQPAAATAALAPPPSSAPLAPAAAIPGQGAPSSDAAPAPAAGPAVPSANPPATPQPLPAADQPPTQAEGPPSPTVEAAAEPPPAETPATGGAASQVDSSGAPPRPEAQPVASRPAPAAEELLPAAPPLAPVPPVRVSAVRPPPARSAPVIDRTCSQALFRFQQGERLSAAEQIFIRNGCSTSRR